MEKFILNGNVQPEYLAESLKIYLHKCNIYIKGCKKRGKTLEMENTMLRMRQIISRHPYSSYHG